MILDLGMIFSGGFKCESLAPFRPIWLLSVCVIEDWWLDSQNEPKIFDGAKADKTEEFF